MGIKDFFKPTVVKIVLSVILFLLTWVSLNKAIQQPFPGDIEDLFWPRVFGLSQPFFDIPKGNSDYMLIYNISFVFDSIVNVAVSYTLSCVAVWIYRKFRFR